MHSVVRRHAVRFLLAASVVGFVAGGARVHAQAPRSGGTPARYTESTAVLVWQGRILPIITDIMTSLNDLDDAMQRSDLAGVSSTAAQFSGELVRFRIVSPTPARVKPTSRLIVSGLTDLSRGTTALVDGLRMSSRSAVQRATSQIDRGVSEFQNAIEQIRRASGPAGEPTVAPAHAGPSPTPIIRGLP